MNGAALLNKLGHRSWDRSSLGGYIGAVLFSRVSGPIMASEGTLSHILYFHSETLHRRRSQQLIYLLSCTFTWQQQRSICSIPACLCQRRKENPFIPRTHSPHLPPTNSPLEIGLHRRRSTPRTAHIHPLKGPLKSRRAQRTHIAIPMAGVTTRHLIAMPRRADLATALAPGSRSRPTVSIILIARPILIQRAHRYSPTCHGGLVGAGVSWAAARCWRRGVGHEAAAVVGVEGEHVGAYPCFFTVGLGTVAAVSAAGVVAHGT